jgi:hypothetical protein
LASIAGVLARPGDLDARHQRQLCLGQVGVRARVRVGEVQASARDSDQDLALTRGRDVLLDELQNLRPTELVDLDGAHRAGI